MAVEGVPRSDAMLSAHVRTAKGLRPSRIQLSDPSTLRPLGFQLQDTVRQDSTGGHRGDDTLENGATAWDLSGDGANHVIPRRPGGTTTKRDVIVYVLLQKVEGPSLALVVDHRLFLQLFDRGLHFKGKGWIPRSKKSGVEF